MAHFFRVSKRYAKGLFDVAMEQKLIDVLQADAVALLKFLKQDTIIKGFLKNPVIEPKKKNQFIKEAFKNLHPLFVNFLLLVSNHKRLYALQEMLEKFLDMVDEYKGIQKVYIKSATPLSEKMIKNILNKSSIVDKSKQHSIIHTIDPSLIGGFVIRVGDEQIDASVKNQLTKLSHDFTNNLYVPKF